MNSQWKEIFVLIKSSQTEQFYLNTEYTLGKVSNQKYFCFNQFEIVELGKNCANTYGSVLPTHASYTTLKLH